MSERVFRIGDRVTVRAAYPPGHVRAPFYVRGRTGTIVARCGRFDNPEALAYGRTGDPRMLYRVSFDAAVLWQRAEPGVSVIVDVYDHWLVPLANGG